MRRLSTVAGERWLMLLLSLIIATALWFSVKGVSRQVVLPGRPEIALRTVPVIPTLVGTPADGFAVLSVEVRPQAVTVTGPKATIEGIELVYTTAVEIRGVRDDLTRTVPLELPPVVQATAPVTVTVRVGAATTRRVLPGARVVLQGLPDGLQASAAPLEVAVEVEGPPALVGGLRPSDLPAVVQVGTLTPGRHRLRPQVQAPAGIRVVGLRPAAVVVTVRRIIP